MNNAFSLFQSVSAHLPRSRHTAVSIALGLFLGSAVFAEMDHTHHAAATHDTHEAMHEHVMTVDEHAGHETMEDHSAHMKMMASPTGYERSTGHYPLPEMTLVGADGHPVHLQNLLAEERPVILNFIYTSCTTVCPILSATLSQASKAFNDDAVKPLMVSISIDPEYDSPERLRDYAARYHAGEDWHFLTGDPASVVALQRAFGSYYGSKQNHQPVSFLRQGPDQPWLRLQGFTTSADLVTEYRALLDSRS